MILVMLVVLGLIMGSFVNALVWRLHEGLDWVKGRSECPVCHHRLAAKDLIPVFSWLFLRGKCRYCRAPIPDSPLVELAVPLVFVVSYLCWPVPLAGQGLFDFVLWLVFVVGFTVLAVYDLRWFILPDRVLFPLLAMAVFQVLADWLVFDGSWRTLFGPVSGALALSGLFYAIYRLSGGKWIGFGDVKLGIVLGLLAGSLLPTILLLFIASLIGTLIAVVLMTLGKAHRKTLLPFGPLLITSLMIVQLWGGAILDWYRTLVVP